LLHFICEYKGHFTPENLQKKMAARKVEMALTTIYRNLPALLKAGIIRRTTLFEDQGKSAAVYEHVWGRPHHDHLVCQNCGKRVEFQYPALEVLQEAAAREHGFALVSHHLELIGLCPDCQQTADSAGKGKESDS